jgi:HEAT repeat protein
MPHAHPVAFAVAFFLAAPSLLAAPPPAAPAPNPAPASTPPPAPPSGLAPAGGGLPALEVKVDLARGVVSANGAETPIPIERGALPPESAVAVEAVAIGEGKHVIRVRVPTRDADDANGPAWEAVFAAGRKDPIFAGMTGPSAGDPGERTGKAVRVVPNGSTSFILVGDTREDLAICGQSATLLDPLALYPGPLELRPATVQRLTAEQQASAEPVTATVRSAPADPPLARLLVARGSSVAGSRGAELTDGDPSTLWRERRPGVGQGEFVVMSAPKGVPITRVDVTVSPPDAAANAKSPSGAGPRSFYLVTTTGVVEVTLPTDGWQKAGSTYEVVFAKPLETSCMALVLDDAFTRGLAHPDVGIAELRAYSEFDAPGASLDDVARRLSSDRGFAASQLLERAGEGALAAVASAYDGLDARGRALAIDVATSHEKCEEAAPLLARGLCEPEGQAARKAREKLERCKGGAPALARRLRDDAASRACLAPVLATIAPDAALEPIADALASTGEDDHETRAVLRDSFAHALAAVPAGPLAALLGDAKRTAAGRLELLRAAGSRVAEAPAESEATLAELLTGAQPMRVRYLALGPLGELARAGDRAAAARIADAIARDPDWPVRARAAGLGGGLPEAVGPLVGAARDPEPRVREAALGALAAAPSPDAVRAAMDALTKDGRLRLDEWWFVKAQGVALLVTAPPSTETDAALGAALRDVSVRVRTAALVALAKRRASSWRGPIGERLDDPGEEPEVRVAAARALGGVCDDDRDTIERLTAYARALASPTAEEDAQRIGYGALLGLAALQPKDLRDRLAPLLAAGAPPYVRVAAQQALAARSSCR